MQWACLFLPQLALDAVLRDIDDPSASVALLDGPAQRRVLHAVSPAARTMGLRTGMTLAAAQALGARCRYVPLDARQVERTRQWLASWAYGFSSQVSLDLPHAIVLEVGRSRLLFGSWPQLEPVLRAALRAKGFRHRIVVAPTPHAARVLANVQDGLAVDEPALRRALDVIPIERSGFPPETTQAFVRMGLRRLGDVLKAPRASIRRRFPAPVLQHLDRLLGEADALTVYQPPDRFEARIEFEYDVESSLALLFPLRRLTADLAAFLVSRDDGVQHFSLWMEHERCGDSEVRVGLLAPERDATMLFELARGRVEQARMPAPVRAMRLEARELPRFVPAARDLFQARPHQQMAWTQVRERLRSRLGDSAVCGLHWHADHRPERVAFSDGVAMPAQPPTLHRPGWLVRAPRPIEASTARVLAGPERLETGWWDGDDIRRDYYVMELPTGQRAWAYRPLRHADGSAPPFLLHGWFA